MQTHGSALIRHRLSCRGVVQGVGLRPAVYRLGKALGLCGFVRNDGDGATIEIEGPAANVAAFEAQLAAALPPLAHLQHVEKSAIAPQSTPDFAIAHTVDGRRGEAMVPPDVALCRHCRAELEDPRDRRHRYPFTNCTDCGPRFSLVRALPYDRERTAMACFAMCPACRAEYEDPESRRFHAEAICCPQCGPRLWLASAGGAEIAVGNDALAAARGLLATGAIVAIKGIGGFQLAYRADRHSAVALLRRRKQRPRKPLAVMVRDLATAERLVHLAPGHCELLTGHAAPIVLAPRRLTTALAAEVAPGIGDLGVMLPTTALHVELFRDAPFDALVMTSGNRSDEPICLGNREALRRLSGIADAFLLHDRDVVRRVDDSVVRAASLVPIVVRRSRGYAPAALPLPAMPPVPVLALGGHLQSTVCMAVGAHAFVSQHVGDLDSESARAFLRETALGLEQFLDCKALAIAADTHPDYASTWLAEELAQTRGARVVRVPHHLAHMAATLAERGAFPRPGQRATALILDGTGHGADGTAWGAELLQLDGCLRWSRLCCGEPLPLVGGEAAVREPWRIAASVLAAAGLADRLSELPLGKQIDRDRLAGIADLAQRSWPLAHGAGRLFEAAGALLGVCTHNDYEGEAAACCEALAARCTVDQAPWSEVTLTADRDEVPHRALLLAAARRLLDGEAPSAVARGLHRTYAALWAARIQRQLPAGAAIALGGGCFVNRFLLHDLHAALTGSGHTVLLPRDLPPGDGGLAYGQCVIAATALARECVPTFQSPS